MKIVKSAVLFILCLSYLFSLAACDNSDKETQQYPPYYEQLRDSIGQPWQDVVTELGLNPEDTDLYGNGYVILPEKAEFIGHRFHVVLKVQPDYLDDAGAFVWFSYIHEYTGSSNETEIRTAAEDYFKLHESFTQVHGEAKPSHIAPLGSTVEELYEAFCDPKQSMEFAQIGEWDFSDGMTFTAAIGPYVKNELNLVLSYIPNENLN